MIYSMPFSIKSLFVPAAMLLLAAASADAEQFEFRVGNEVTVQELSTLQPPAAPRSTPTQYTSSTTNYSAQVGQGNSAAFFTSGSPGALGISFQAGRDNLAGAMIVNSPGSGIAQVQVGQSNYSMVSILGGYSNLVSTGQIGNNLGMNVTLVNSVRTRLVYGQAGSGYGGAITIRNAPAGTTVRLK